MLTGFVQIGAVFSISRLDNQVLLTTIMLACIAFSSITGLYAFNAYQGREEDRKNDRLKALHDIPGSVFIISFLILFGIALIIGSQINIELVFLVLILGLSGIIYSIKGIGKDRPIGGSLIHLIFQMTAFHIGYVAFEPVSSSSILLAIYFSLLYMAGHLHHQVIDFEADLSVSTQTGAVQWGIKKAQLFSFGLFTIAAVYWVILYFANIIDQIALIPFLVAYSLQLILFLTIHQSFENVASNRTLYRTAYRLLYFAAGLTVLGFILHGH